MIVSELTAQFVGEWLGYAVQGGELSEGDSRDLTAALAAAKARAKGYTGLTDDQLDEHEDITIAVLGLCNDFLTGNRPEAAESGMNRMSAAILAMHSVNLL